MLECHKQGGTPVLLDIKAPSSIDATMISPQVVISGDHIGLPLWNCLAR
jgi:hypothetical protein